MKIKECMSLNVACCSPETKVNEVAKIMNEKHVGCIPVCDANKKVVGLITDRDIVLRCVACDKDLSQTMASEIMTTNVCTCSVEQDVEEATKLMSELQIRRIPVLENDEIVGILTVADLAEHEKVSTKELSNTVENICNCDTNKNNA